MPKFFLPNERNSEVREVSDRIEIVGNDAHHISRTLRMKVSDSLTVSDSRGIDYSCTIEKITSDSVVLKINSVDKSLTESDIRTSVFQALVKYDKMDTVIQKSVELGATDIYPVAADRCVVKLDGDARAKKVERWNKIALEAAKQCGRGRVPKVHEVVDMRECIEKMCEHEINFFCYESSEGRTVKDVIRGKSFSSIAFFIGPEGGIAPSEASLMQNAGIIDVSLGSLILRTETAGPAVLAMLLYETRL